MRQYLRWPKGVDPAWLGRVIADARALARRTLASSPAAPDPAAVQALSPACVHRLDRTGDTVSCLSCGGRRTELKVFGCGVHGVCLIANEGQGMACCRSCKDRRPSADAAAGS